MKILPSYKVISGIYLIQTYINHSWTLAKHFKCDHTTKLEFAGLSSL